MSGLFWEPDRQPNICEAASGFTFSTINLLVAIPMFLLDLVVTAVTSGLALVAFLTAPLLEVLVLGTETVLEALGISLELPADLPAVLLPPVVGLLLLVGVYRGPCPAARVSRHQSAARLLATCKCLGWMCVLLAAAAASANNTTAVLPGLLVLGLAVQGMGYTGKALLAEHANFWPGNVSPLAGTVATMTTCADMETAAAFTAAAFGIPSLTEADTAVQYLCLVPLVAAIITYTGMERLQPPAPVAAANGEAVAVAEETTTVPEAVQEVEVETSPAAAEEEAAPAAAAAEAPADEKPAENGAAAAPAADAPDTAAATKDDLMLAAKLYGQLTGLISCLTGRVCGLLAPATSRLSHGTAALYNLPWLAITLCVTANLSHLLAGHAWAALSGGNQLAYCLPVLTLLLPMGLKRYGGNCEYLAHVPEVAGLATLWLQYALLTGPVGQE